jgi:predicted  nucleic acid-binding Zn-ribbon protein
VNDKRKMKEVNADEIRYSINLKSLQRHDCNIISIESSTSYVVIYNLVLSTNEWIKLDIQGPLFLFKR